MISALGYSPPNNLFPASVRGIARGIEMASAASKLITEGDLSPENRVDLMTSEITVQANAAVVRTGDQLLGSILNVKA